jgi:hypothetical protein
LAREAAWEVFAVALAVATRLGCEEVCEEDEDMTRVSVICATVARAASSATAAEAFSRRCKACKCAAMFWLPRFTSLRRLARRDIV